MNILHKMMLVIVASSSMGQLIASAAKVKPIKIKMVKTDPASRGKTWTYALVDTEKVRPFKTIKKDATISVVPGQLIIVCTSNKKDLNCPQQQIPLTVTKDMVIALDQEGKVSLKTADEVKKMLASMVEKQISLSNLVQISVQIPTTRVTAPFTLKSAPQATGSEYYDKKKVTELDVRTVEGAQHGSKRYYLVPLSVEKVDAGQRSKASFISINDNPGKPIIIRAEDEIKAGSKIRMGTSENVFFVVNPSEIYRSQQHRENI